MGAIVSKDTGGPAFPVSIDSAAHAGMKVGAEMGMTLRDYFAANASEEDIQSILCEHMALDGYGETICTISRQQARYLHADAMLKERSDEQ